MSSKETGYTARCRVQIKQEEYEQLQPVDSQKGHCRSPSISLPKKSPRFQLEDCWHLLSIIVTFIFVSRLISLSNLQLFGQRDCP